MNNFYPKCGQEDDGSCVVDEDLPLQLYHGDNGVHDFWESPDHKLILFRNPGKTRWQIWKGVWDACLGTHTFLPAAIKLAEEALGIEIQLIYSKEWVRVDEDKDMVLQEVKT
ncbi:MAG: hypothetical protein ABH950_01210 [Candidatus Altiarchaeota archaeon]